MHFLLLPEELIKKVYHQHPIFWFRYLFLSLSAVFIVAYLLLSYDLFAKFSKVFFVFVLSVVIYFLKELYLWYKNMYIITNQRLLVIRHDGLFKKTVIETPLERILNVSYKTTGGFSVLLQYGDVEVQVVGLVEPVILKHISSPEEIKDYLWLMHKRYVEKQISYQPQKIATYQEDMGYTKDNQKIL